MKQQWAIKLVLGWALIFSGLVQLSAQECTSDCVWPGDLNANGVANSLDVLTLGFTLGQTGPPRANQITTWDPLLAENWLQAPTFGANLKHVDANGDGLITELDKDPVSFNYGDVNDSFIGLLGNDLAGNDLYLVPEQTSISPGDSLYINVFLGDANNQIDSIYGIAFELNIDTQYVDLVLFDFSETWLGSPEELVTYGKFREQTDRIGFATTRIDGQAVSGHGQIGRMQVIITDVILGLELDSTACLPFSLELTNVLGINTDEADLQITSAPSPPVVLKHASQLTSAGQADGGNQELFVYPNPTNSNLFIEASTELEQLSLWSLSGKRVDLPLPPLRGQSFISLPVSSLPPGIYLLRLQLAGQNIHRKIVIR